MGFLDNIKSFFSVKISDEEIAKHDWILCQNCNVNITREDLESNGGHCPNCGYNISREI